MKKEELTTENTEIQWIEKPWLWKQDGKYHAAFICGVACGRVVETYPGWWPVWLVKLVSIF